MAAVVKFTPTVVKFTPVGACSLVGVSAEFGTLGGKSLSSTLVGAFSLVGWYLGKNVDRLWSLSSHLQSLSSHRLVCVW